MSQSRQILCVNGGSSSIKFGVFTFAPQQELVIRGEIERIGQPSTRLKGTDEGSGQEFAANIDAKDHYQAAYQLINWLEKWKRETEFVAVAHRVVTGGLGTNDHQLVSPTLMNELNGAKALDLTHLPREIALIESFQSRWTAIPQIACFDTVFHRDLPRVAQILPIPRRYLDRGVRRLGFHGLSFAYLMQELEHAAGAGGRTILAHLGSGASLSAVLNGQPVDTSMAFTPTAGLTMGTRPGDLDPGLVVYLVRAEKLTPDQLDDFVSHECGLLGVSGISADVRELIARRESDPHAAEALDLFCYQAKKWIGAYAAALGGVDNLVFSGGIGEHSPEVRAGICGGLEFLGIRLELSRNARSEPIISAADSRVIVRVIPTDEELMMARIVFDLVSRSEDHA